MNDFARYSGDDVFKKTMIGVSIAGLVFALCMILY